MFKVNWHYISILIVLVVSRTIDDILIGKGNLPEDYFFEAAQKVKSTSFT